VVIWWKPSDFGDDRGRGLEDELAWFTRTRRVLKHVLGLLAAGAEAVLPDLTDTDGLLRLVLGAG